MTLKLGEKRLAAEIFETEGLLAAELAAQAALPIYRRKIGGRMRARELGFLVRLGCGIRVWRLDFIEMHSVPSAKFSARHSSASHVPRAGFTFISQQRRVTSVHEIDDRHITVLTNVQLVLLDRATTRRCSQAPDIPVAAWQPCAPALAPARRRSQRREPRSFRRAAGAGGLHTEPAYLSKIWALSGRACRASDHQNPHRNTAP